MQENCSFAGVMIPKESGVQTLPTWTHEAAARSQVQPEAHSFCELQWVKQVSFWSLHAKPAQESVEVTAQTPAPSHEDLTTKAPWHPVVPQGLPLAANRLQLPLPSQVPSPPQSSVEARHPPRGFCPGRVGPQTPGEPETVFSGEQLRQAPLHAWLQHTPSTQNPEVH